MHKTLWNTDTDLELQNNNSQYWYIDSTEKEFQKLPDAISNMASLPFIAQYKLLCNVIDRLFC